MVRGHILESASRRSDETLLEMEVAVRREYGVAAVLIQNGAFYEAYNDSSYVLTSELGYKSAVNAWGARMTGFPVYALHQVVDRLESSDVTLAVVDQTAADGFHGRRLRAVTYVSRRSPPGLVREDRPTRDPNHKSPQTFDGETVTSKSGDDSLAPNRHGLDELPTRYITRSELRVVTLDGRKVIISPFGEVVMQIPMNSTTSMEWFLHEATKRHNYPRHGDRWTEEEDLLLSRRFVRGTTMKELARLHKRAPGGIRSRLVKLGLKK